jgi:hypothetical protein
VNLYSRSEVKRQVRQPDDTDVQSAVTFNKQTGQIEPFAGRKRNVQKRSPQVSVEQPSRSTVPGQVVPFTAKREVRFAFPYWFALTY